MQSDDEDGSPEPSISNWRETPAVLLHTPPMAGSPPSNLVYDASPMSARSPDRASFSLGGVSPQPKKKTKKK